MPSFFFIHHQCLAAVAKPDRVEVAFVFVGLTLTGIIWGMKIFRIGLRGWQKGQYPLSSEKMLHGRLARAAASVIMLFGMISMACGISAGVFGWFRIQQLF